VPKGQSDFKQGLQREWGEEKRLVQGERGAQSSSRGEENRGNSLRKRGGGGIRLAIRDLRKKNPYPNKGGGGATGKVANLRSQPFVGKMRKGKMVRG